MSDFGPPLRKLLAPAVSAARAALADLDAKEIPPSLRRVASYSGGSLPPPLARSVVAALDDDEWLRERALEELDEDPESAASSAFLRRDEGWWSVIASELAAMLTADAASAQARLSGKVADLEAKLVVAKKRLKQAGEDLDAERVRARRLMSERARPEGRRKRMDGGLERKELQKQLDEVATERAEAEARIARLRARLQSVLREQRRAAPEGGPDTVLGGDPIGRARHLDLMAAVAPHRFDEPDDTGDRGAPPEDRLRLPSGVRPDSADAVEWLIAARRPVTVIVDGYNVLYGLDATTFTTASARRLLAERLAHLRRSLDRSVVAVVYDSDLPGEREMRVAGGGVEVHFSEADELADDAIVAMTREAIGDVVVVTSDRDLRERVESVGGLPLWSEALIDWLGTA